MKIKTKKIVTTHRKTNPDATKAEKYGRLLNIISFYIIMAFFVVATIISMVGDLYSIVFIIGLVQFALSLAALPILIYNHHTFQKAVDIIFIVLASLTFIQIFLSLFLYCFEKGYTRLFGWHVFAFYIIAFVLSLSSIVISRITHQSDFKYVIVIKDVKITSNLEMELSETKRLLDFNYVTQEEYENLRKSVIAKYTRD